MSNTSQGPSPNTRSPDQTDGAFAMTENLDEVVDFVPSSGLAQHNLSISNGQYELPISNMDIEFGSFPLPISHDHDNGSSDGTSLSQTWSIIDIAKEHQADSTSWPPLANFNDVGMFASSLPENNFRADISSSDRPLDLLHNAGLDLDHVATLNANQTFRMSPTDQSWTTVSSTNILDTMGLFHDDIYSLDGSGLNDKLATYGYASLQASASPTSDPRAISEASVDISIPANSPLGTETFDIHSQASVIQLATDASPSTNSNSYIDSIVLPDQSFDALMMASLTRIPTNSHDDIHQDGIVSSRLGSVPDSIHSEAMSTTNKRGTETRRRVRKRRTVQQTGKRRGPLRPEQRIQAHAIRKVGACLRCRYLKKTCDTGQPCQSCRPGHLRLWQVPCSRIDIRDLAYFMRDWKADYERHSTLSFSIDNIRSFDSDEVTILITHGYGHVLPLLVRQVSVRQEDDCFEMEWIESDQPKQTQHSVHTAHFAVGVDGINTDDLMQYLDAHVEQDFDRFIASYYVGTPFIPGFLQTIYQYYRREHTPIIRKTLKFLLAYNLTMHVTLIEGPCGVSDAAGKIADGASRYAGQTAAPVMVAFSVKVALAGIWRKLQAEILEELSTLYSSVYAKDKLKHWPSIFMVVCILMTVWEQMQFDCHYRVQDENAIRDFCDEMESIPTGTIIGLFGAISQRLPLLHDWDTSVHHGLLGSGGAICDALTEMQAHLCRHDRYLRTRTELAFDPDDFDSLSCKFSSQLFIRSTA